MDIILNNIAAALTALFGIWAYLFPNKAARALFLTPHKQYGISEIRSTYGAFMFAMGGFAIYAQTELTFQYLGVCYLVTSLGRSLSFVFDKAFSKITIRFVIFEVICGAMCLI